MKPGMLLFIFIVVGYFAFEIYAVSKVSYRTEPVYIFERFVAVDRAMNRCGQSGNDTKVDFDRNLAAVQRRAELELLEQNPSKSVNDIQAFLTQTERQQQAEVDTLIDELGCDDIELFKLVRGYANRARLNIHAPSD